MKTGAELIAEERLRQIEEEGYTAKYDDEYKSGEMAIAAACYAVPVEYREEFWLNNVFTTIDTFYGGRKWWKPDVNDRIHELKKSGALIAAEIDRLQRLNNGKEIDAGKKRC